VPLSYSSKEKPRLEAFRMLVMPVT